MAQETTKNDRRDLEADVIIVGSGAAGSESRVHLQTAAANNE